MSLLQRKLDNPFLCKLSFNEFVFLLALSKIKDAPNIIELYRRAVTLVPFSACFTYPECQKLINQAVKGNLIEVVYFPHIQIIWLIDI